MLCRTLKPPRKGPYILRTLERDPKYLLSISSKLPTVDSVINKGGPRCAGLVVSYQGCRPVFHKSPATSRLGRRGAGQKKASMHSARQDANRSRIRTPYCETSHGLTVHMRLSIVGQDGGVQCGRCENVQRTDSAFSIIATWTL